MGRKAVEDGARFVLRLPEKGTFLIFLLSPRSVHGKVPSGAMWEAHKALAVNSPMLWATFTLPPGTPADRIKLLRHAMARVAEDPGFTADWERAFGEEFAGVSNPAETAERVKNDFLKPAPWQKFLRSFVKE